jgi:hypothetical protein
LSWQVLKVICNIEQAANTNQAGSPQHNLGQPQAANTNQAAYPQHSPEQQQATNRTQAGSQLHKPGKQQAANANQAGSPQDHNAVQVSLRYYHENFIA